MAIKYFSVNKKEKEYTILKDMNNSRLYEITNTKLPPFLNIGDVIKKVGFSYEFDFQKTREIKGNS